jgi:cbb3-type cytochrome oxidase maturation protein
MDVTFYLFFMSFLVSLSAWCIFLWAVRTGQFRDVEEIKYQVWPKTVDERDSQLDTADAARG